MKKILTVILTTLLILLCASPSAADGGHVIIDNTDPVLNESQWMQLEEDLEHIKEDYGINIYFVYDPLIADDDVNGYAERLLNAQHIDGENTVVLVLNDNYYSVKAAGDQSYLVLQDYQEVFNKFYVESSWYAGIVAYYQYVVSLINYQTYESAVDKVEGTPNLVDFADLLTDEEEKTVSARLSEVSKDYGIDVVAVLADDINGMSPQEYADDFYDYNGYPNDGVLLLVSMAERDWYISTKGKGISYITDYGVDYIADQFLGDLSGGNYAKALINYADSAEALFRNAENGSIIDDNNPVPMTFGYQNIIIGVICGLIVALIVVLILKGQLKSVKRERYAGKYIVEDSFYLNGFADMFINKSVTRSAIPKDTDSSSGGGGGSSFHTSSSGSSHGGHGGKF